ncbi:MAG: hypothetical protein ABSH50_25810 [Bryobacteraceae bacterium]|jgi:hypothetical protein
MFARSFALVSALLAAATGARPQTVFPDHCPSGSTLPFANIQVSQSIDQSCPALTGDPEAAARSQTQDQAKNNFCADAAHPVTYTPQMFVDLQAKAVTNGIPSGQGQEPATRDGPRALGEGTVVRLKAYLIEAHYADLGDGESVNCYKPSTAENDIHVALGVAPDTKECASISAEISPHYRPAAWSDIGLFETLTGKKYVVDPQRSSRLQQHPYRVTGQLFYDASHKPCPCGASNCDGDPSRASNWEIHPVYKIEVCKAGASCDEGDDSAWMPFDVWWSSLAPIQKVAKPHTHESNEGKKTKPKP